MAILLIQSGKKGVINNPFTIPFASNNSAGNIIIISLAAGTSTDCTPSDSKANTYKQVGSWKADTGSNAFISIWFAANILGGPNTITISGGAQFNAAVAAEFSGVAATSPLDGTFFGGNNGSSLTDAGLVFTPTSGDLLIGAHVDNGTNAVGTPSTGWSEGASSALRNNNADNDNAMEYQIASGGSYKIGWGLTSSVDWADFWAAFKPSVSGGAQYVPFLTTLGVG